MKAFFYRLKFPWGVHFGQHGIGLEESSIVLSSDSLTSALVNACAVIGKADEIINALSSNPPVLTLSSLFPYGPVFENGRARQAYAFPKPLDNPPLSEDAREYLRSSGKDIKKLRYIESKDLIMWLGKEPLSAKDLSNIKNRGMALAKPYNADDRSGWYVIELRPRVALDRDTCNSSIWYCSIVRFVESAGLFGLVTVEDDKHLKFLENAFILLGEMGLGGERTYGIGSFEFQGFEPLENLLPEFTTLFSDRYLLLSRYFPRKDEITTLSEQLLAWTIEENRGFVSSGRYGTTLKRKRLFLFAEGTVSRKPFQGCLVDVTPQIGPSMGLDHKVFRSGLGFWFPLPRL
ncbi:MAG: type III-A CRISPR-associated RAMP protein Csm4 [Thermodesulforhabdaceae bacterium]